jgi:DNA primase catalytic core
MPRIPEPEIERIKRETDLAALVRSRGVDLAKHGTKDLIGTCPFHDDRDPSFVVTPEKGLFHCLGCGAAGNVIQFVEKFDGVSFRHAFEILAEGRGFTVATTEPLKTSTIQRLDLPFDPTSDDAALMRQVVDYYHERLLKTPAALEYLDKRGLLNDEAIERHRLGFADRSLGLRLPDKNRKEGEAIRTRLQKLGLYRESGHEHFTGSVVVPIFSARGCENRSANARCSCWNSSSISAIACALRVTADTCSSAEARLASACANAAWGSSAPSERSAA